MDKELQDILDSARYALQYALTNPSGSSDVEKAEDVKCVINIEIRILNEWLERHPNWNLAATCEEDLYRHPAA